MDAWLASNSPRRYALIQPLFPDLHHAGLDGVDETPPSGTVGEQVSTICHRKADAVPDSTHSLVIVADTMLSDPDEHSLSMGKPRDLAHAATMLLRLSGRLHQVWSATAVRWNGVWHRWCESAVVSIPELTADQMDALLTSNSWVGKAGGYALQSLGSRFVKKIRGCYTNVIGISIPELYKILKNPEL